MSKLYVEELSTCVHSFYSTEKWGDWEVQNSYNGLKVYADDWSQGYSTGRYTLDVDFKPKPGEVVYVVVALYETGNTFGRESGCVSIVAAFNNADDATELARLIRDNASGNDKYPYDYDVELNDKKYSTSAWTGYFERLESVFVETEIVRA